MDNCTKGPLDSLFNAFQLNHVINAMLHWTASLLFQRHLFLHQPNLIHLMHLKVGKTHSPWPLFLFSPRTKH